MFKIFLTKEIETPKEIVWGVISNTEYYPEWNKFVVACDSTFKVGSPIKMKVMVLPFIAMPQKETILQHMEGEFLEYGIKIPLGLLSSYRQHILKSTSENTTKYESIFILKGLLAPIVGFLLGSQLNRGFNDMTNGLVSRSLEVYANQNV